MRRYAYEIFSTFLIPNAPLQLPEINQTIIQNIDKILRAFTASEQQQPLPPIEQLKKLFIAARTRAVGQINKLLAEFRASKLIKQQTMQYLSTQLNIDLNQLDMSSTTSINHLTELKAAEQILFRLLETLLHMVGITTNYADLMPDSQQQQTYDSKTLALIMSISTIIKV